MAENIKEKNLFNLNCFTKKKEIINILNYAHDVLSTNPTIWKQNR